MFESKRALLQNQTFLLGYVSSGSQSVVIDGSSFELTFFQGEHSEEYVMRKESGEDESVQNQLFDKGLLKMSWTTVNGVRTGPLTLYENGVVACRMDWKEMEKEDYVRSFENRRHGVQMILTDVSTGHVVYRGQFDEAMERSGYGYEYDEETGRVLRYGVFKKNALYHLLKQFEKERMIEYVEDDSENVTCIFNRRPIYVGGYCYDETGEIYLRDGLGYEIDVDTGVACRESRWSKGECLDGALCPLNSGWFASTPWTDVSFRCGAHKGAITLPEVKKQAQYICNDALVTRRNSQLGELSGLPTSVTEIVIPDDCYNEQTLTSLSIRSFPLLKMFVVGRNCFRWVKTLVFGERAIDQIQIGIGSFPSVIECVCCGGLMARLQGNGVINQSVASPEDLQQVSHAVTDLVVEAGCCNDGTMQTWDLTPYWQLKSVLVESGNLNDVRVIDMTGLTRLRSFTFQSICFGHVEKVLPPLITCDYSIRSRQEYERIPTHVTTLRVCSGSCNEEEFTEFDLRRFGLLQRLVFGDRCLIHVKSFPASPLLKLVSVSGEPTIVPNDTVMRMEEISPFVFSLEIGKRVKLEEEALYLRDYAYLASLVIGEDSFTSIGDWFIQDLPRLSSLRLEGASSSKSQKTLQISRCNALSNVYIGNDLFTNGSSLNLISLPKLEVLTIGNSVVFCNARSITFERLPSLTTIEIGDHSFVNNATYTFSGTIVRSVRVRPPESCRDQNRQGIVLWDRGIETRERPWGKHSENDRYVRWLRRHIDLPSLDRFVAQDKAFYGVGRVEITNMPNLQECTFQKEAFRLVQYLDAENASTLESAIRRAARYPINPDRYYRYYYSLS